MYNTFEMQYEKIYDRKFDVLNCINLLELKLDPNERPKSSFGSSNSPSQRCRACANPANQSKVGLAPAVVAFGIVRDDFKYLECKDGWISYVFRSAF